MWSDNETTVDLLGFDYLVDSLEVVLTQPGLLPLTVGVLGDWGSGKTSLLQMAQARLDAAEGFVTVFFSPWRALATEIFASCLSDRGLVALDRGARSVRHDVTVLVVAVTTATAELLKTREGSAARNTRGTGI